MSNKNLRDLSTEYRNVLNRREELIQLLREELTVLHGSYQYIPMLQPQDIDAITYEINKYKLIQNINRSIVYHKITDMGEFIEEIIFPKILTVNNIERLLKDAE